MNKPNRGFSCVLALAVLLVSFVWCTDRTEPPAGLPPTVSSRSSARSFDEKIETFQTSAQVERARLELTEDEINAKIAVELAYQTGPLHVRDARVHLRHGEIAVESTVALARLEMPLRTVLTTVRTEDGIARLVPGDVDLGWVNDVPVLGPWLTAQFRQRLGEETLPFEQFAVETIIVEPGYLVALARPTDQR